MIDFDARNDDDRIVRIRTESSGSAGSRRTQSLTGYIVADELVMTCAHDVLGDKSIQVKHTGRDLDLPGSVEWPLKGVDDVDSRVLDVALVKVPGLTAPPGRQVVWGEYSGFVGQVDAAGFGYPLASGDGTRLHSTPIQGSFTPGEGRERDRLVFTVTSARPSEPKHWAGLSGMMIRDPNGYLLGVAAQMPEGWDGRKFFVVPARLIWDQPRLRNLLRDVPLETLSSHHPLLKPAFERLGEETEFKLITARYGQVPFVEQSHGSDLEDLMDWCTDAEAASAGGLDCGVRVRMLLGPGGSGKTRLAAELCERIQASDQQWLAGFAREEEGAPWDSHEPQHPTLVVFDYVERPAISSKVARFLKHLDSLGPALQARVRVLLVSRNVHEWHDHIDLQGGGILSRRLRAETGSPRITLTELGFTSERRELHFKEAFKRFAQGTDRAGMDLTDHLKVLKDDDFNSPLLVHIAALLAARGDSVPFAKAAELQSTLLTYLIRRERFSRWADEPTLTTTRAAPELSNQALHAVAIMTLTTPTVQEADEFLKASKLWTDQNNAARREAVRAVMRLYPGTDEDGKPNDRAAPIEPDLVSEHLLMEIDDLEDLLEKLHQQQLTVRHYARLLHVLSLACDHYKALGTRHFQTSLREALKHVGDVASHESMRGGSAVADLLGQSLPRLIQSATRQSGEHDPATAAILTGALTNMVDNQHMQAMAAGLEFASCEGRRELVELRCALLSLAVRHHRRNQDHQALLACLERLIDTLLELQRHAETMEPLKELLNLREALGQTDPTQYLGNVVQLDGLMRRLLDQDRHDDVYELLDIAMRLHRRLHEDDFLLYQKYLVVFDELHPVQRRSGRLLDSLGMVRESIRGRQMLGAGDTASLSEPILALYRLADLFLTRKDHATAASTAIEAVELLQSLDQSDSQVYEKFLEVVDRALVRLMNDEKFLGFMTPLRKSMKIREWLAKRAPATLPQYAEALEAYGNRLWKLGVGKEAIRYFRKAVDIRARLTDEDHPESRLAYLSSLYDLIASLMRDDAGSEESTAVITLAVDQWQELVDLTPDAEMELACLLEVQAYIEMGADRPKAARKAVDRAERVRRRLAADGESRHRRTSSLYQKELAKSHRVGASFPLPSIEERQELLRTMQTAHAESDFLLALLLEQQTRNHSAANSSARGAALLAAVRIYQNMDHDRQHAYEVSHLLARVARSEWHAESKLDTWSVMRQANETLRDCKSMEKANRINVKVLERATDAQKTIAQERNLAGKTFNTSAHVGLMLGVLSPLVVLANWYYLLVLGRADGDADKVGFGLTWGVAIPLLIGTVYLVAVIIGTFWGGFVQLGTDLWEYLKWGFFSSLAPFIAGLVYWGFQQKDLAGVSALVGWTALLGPFLAILVSSGCARLLILMHE